MCESKYNCYKHDEDLVINNEITVIQLVKYGLYRHIP